MKITLIGISDESAPQFSGEILTLVRGAKYFAGGVRHQQIVAQLLPVDNVWVEVKVPLHNVFEAMETQSDHWVVFASGDPLFYGFGGTLKRRFPEAKMQVFPCFNALQMLAHRCNLPYENMQAVSLTGRPWSALDAALIEGKQLIGVLTDRKKTPATIAQRMLCYGYSNYTAVVGQRLGGDLEKIARYSLDEVASKTFDMPNVVMLQQQSPRHIMPGIPDEDFEILPGRPRMMTKAWIRVLSLTAMQIKRRHVMWDVGFCTGSISIEARLQNPALQVVAFEKRALSETLLLKNSQRFGVPGIIPVMGDFLQTDVTKYPAPDAVFIGGHGGKLSEVMTKIDHVMFNNGVVALNAVKQESAEQFLQWAQQHRYLVAHDATIQLDTHNPIRIITIVKQNAEV